MLIIPPPCRRHFETAGLRSALAYVAQHLLRSACRRSDAAGFPATSAASWRGFPFRALTGSPAAWPIGHGSAGGPPGAIGRVQIPAGASLDPRLERQSAPRWRALRIVRDHRARRDRCWSPGPPSPGWPETAQTGASLGIPRQCGDGGSTSTAGWRARPIISEAAEDRGRVARLAYHLPAPAVGVCRPVRRHRLSWVLAIQPMPTTPAYR